MKNLITTLMMIVLLSSQALSQLPQGCGTVQLEWTQNLHFDLSQSIGIQLSDVNGEFIVKITSEGGYEDEFPLNSDFIEFKHLLKTDNYTVTLESNCQSFVVYPQSNVEEVIKLSNSFFNEIAKWSTQEEDENLFDYVVQLANVSPFEKQYFVQEYFFNGHLPDEYIDDVSGIVRPPDTQMPCNCKMILAAQSLLLPIGSELNGSTSPQIEDYGDCWDCRGVKDYWSYHREMNGPAKYERLYSRAANMGSREISTQTSGANQATGKAYLRYNYVCSTGDGLPEDCGCAKDIHLQYHYNTKLFSHTRLVNVLGDEDASATVQDIAAVIVSPHGDIDNINMLAAGDAAIESACDTKINKDWLKSALDVSFTIVEIIAELEGEDFDLSKLAEHANKIKDKLGDLIDEPIRHSTKCESAVQSNQLLNGNHVISLESNKPVDIILLSRSFMKQRGSGGWQIKTKVHSDFSLIGIIREGYGSPALTHCCFPYAASWAMASAHEAEYNLSTCQNFAESYAYQIFPGYRLQINNNYGTDLRRVYSESCPEQKEVKAPDPDAINFLRSTNNSEIDHFQLIDIHGRVISSGTRKSLLKFRPAHSGIYILKNSYQTEKIYLPKY